MNDTSTCLYRHFDKDGRLLYVGISLNAVHRLEQHRHRSNWFSDIARIEVEWLEDRASALRAEAQAIHDEQPLFNKHRPGERRKPKDQPRDNGQRLVGLRHVATGRVDGWYSSEADVVQVLGWFRAVFPAERFEFVTEAQARSIGSIHRGIELKSIDHAKWAAAAPDYVAGDRYEKARTA